MPPRDDREAALIRYLACRLPRSLTGSSALVCPTIATLAKVAKGALPAAALGSEIKGHR
jgi:hypothetical protein